MSSKAIYLGISETITSSVRLPATAFVMLMVLLATLKLVMVEGGRSRLGK